MGFIITHKEIDMKKLVIIPLIVLLGCGASMPKWASSTKCSKGFICAVGIGEADNVTAALALARDDARGQITQQVEVEVSATSNRVIDLVGTRTAASTYVNGLSTIASERLSGMTPKRQYQNKKSGIWTAYVLMEFDEGAFAEKQLELAKKNDEVWQQYRGSELMKEHEKKIEEYRKRKGS